ncbi:hypothetical protein BVI2075_40036 [Burkholderia vietnamiensis]|nr:hypothetical protein BVI1335_1620052 [Burkholderia vietnamiensis]CAG9206993.1 hypothetical protein BVI2075_40036 [Burkholderia vietnamiensis]
MIVRKRIVHHLHDRTLQLAEPLGFLVVIREISLTRIDDKIAVHLRPLAEVCAQAADGRVYRDDLRRVVHTERV